MKDDGVSDRPVPFRVMVTISNAEAITGSDPRPGTGQRHIRRHRCGHLQRVPGGGGLHNPSQSRCVSSDSHHRAPGRWSTCSIVLMLELIQPLAGDNIYAEHLERKGEGLHHVGFFVPSLDWVSRYRLFRARSPAGVNAGVEAGIDLTHKERAAHVCEESPRAFEQWPGAVWLFEYEQGVAVLE
jgi:hypothetical protein